MKITFALYSIIDISKVPDKMDALPAFKYRPWIKHTNVDLYKKLKFSEFTLKQIYVGTNPIELNELHFQLTEGSASKYLITGGANRISNIIELSGIVLGYKITKSHIPQLIIRNFRNYKTISPMIIGDMILPDKEER